MKGILDRTNRTERPATAHEEASFHRRLEAILESTKARLTKLNSNDYELRVMTIRKHDVKAHTRKMFQKVYLAKKITKRKRPRVNPIAAAVMRGNLPTPSVTATVRKGKMTGRVYVKGTGKRVPKNV